MDDSSPQAEMPRYKCHKIVHALKIADKIDVLPDGDVRLHVADGGFAPVTVPKAVVSRYFPQPGDYYVVYDDGYKSISPQKAFEEGYTRL
jgi:hypothetical protein